MKILICGMPRSMTTWTFNVVRELHVQPFARHVWIAPGAPEEAQFAQPGEAALAKCHHFSSSLAEAADVVIYSYRDVRTAAVSYRRKFGSECTRGQIDNWVAAERSWLPYADLVLRYEDVEADPVAAVARVRRLLLGKGAAVGSASDAEIVERVERTFQEVESSTKISYDASTMILPAHRTFQPDPVELPEPEKALHARVESEFGGWLAAHGYSSASNLGQDAEYRLAALVMGACESPTVVDVGVERGSFLQLALGCGVSRVIGFEPLPRHVEHLRERYGSVSNVAIHALALSSASGTATLHVATDAEGRELDYHHSLSDLADTASVIRSRRAIEVRVASLADLVSEGVVPESIDLLKIDTDGHDLQVLEGLGKVRPRAILAEFWDTLPESSGVAPYGLRELADWAAAHAYPAMIVVRRHGRVELVEFDAAWSLPGDWGNVLFLREDFPFAKIEAQVHELARARYAGLCDYVAALARETEAKEAEIRRLDAANAERAALIHQQSAALAGMPTLDVPQASAMAGGPPAPGSREAELARVLEAKEEVIRELSTTLRERTMLLNVYRAGFLPVRIMLAPVRWLAAPLRPYVLKAVNLLTPRLGMLKQHQPRPLVVPRARDGAPAAPARARISLVTPSYNQAQFVERTILSVLEQDYPNLEYVVQDGGSRDGTVDILRRYARQLRWESRRDGGQAQAINRGFEGTSGEIMAWLNSDDVLFPGALAYVADFFERHPEVDVIYGHRILIDEDGRQIGRWVLPAHSDRVLSWADFVPQETLFWRRGMWEKAGGRVDESFHFAMDWDLLLRFRDAGARFARVPCFLGAFRVHGKQKTVAEISDVGIREMDRLRERVLGHVPSEDEVRKALLPYLLKHVAIDMRWKLRDGFLATGVRA